MDDFLRQSNSSLSSTSRNEMHQKTNSLNEWLSVSGSSKAGVVKCRQEAEQFLAAEVMATQDNTRLPPNKAPDTSEMMLFQLQQMMRLGFTYFGRVFFVIYYGLSKFIRGSDVLSLQYLSLFLTCAALIAFISQITLDSGPKLVAIFAYACLTSLLIIFPLNRPGHFVLRWLRCYTPYKIGELDLETAEWASTILGVCGSGFAVGVWQIITDDLKLFLSIAAIVSNALFFTFISASIITFLQKDDLESITKDNSLPDRRRMAMMQESGRTNKFPVLARSDSETTVTTQATSCLTRGSSFLTTQIEFEDGASLRKQRSIVNLRRLETDPVHMVPQILNSASENNN